MKELFLLSCAEMRDGGGVYKYRLTEEGGLEKIAYFPVPKPMYSVWKGDRLHVLLRSPFESNDHSGYFSCKRDFSDCSDVKDTLGKCACHLAADKDVYIVNYLSGNIVKNCKKSVAHIGKGINQPRQDMPHTHFVAFSPDKKYIFCCDLGLDTVFVYDGDLKEISRAKVPSGYGVRHLIFSEDGKYFFTVNELIPSVSVFAYADGKAEYRNTVKLSCRIENSTAAAIRLDEREEKLYVSVRGEDEIFVFKVSGDELFFIRKFPCGGKNPRDFGILGEYIICTNEGSDNVTVIDKKIGRIIGEISMKNPLNVTDASE